MKHRFMPPGDARPRLLDESGVVVLGPLIFIVVAVVLAVVAGELLHADPPLYTERPAPVLHFAHSDVDIYAGGRVVGHLEPGDSAWVVMLDGGVPVVHRGRDDQRVLGIARGLLLRWR